MAKILPLVVILVSCFCDPLRDAWFGRVSWLKWHTVKWIAFYTPLAYILFTAFDTWWIWGLITLAAWITWQIGLHVAGAPWESKSVQWLKWLFHLIFN